jgi:hypothetical protein
MTIYVVTQADREPPIHGAHRSQTRAHLRARRLLKARDLVALAGADGYLRLVGELAGSAAGSRTVTIDVEPVDLVP